MRKLLIATLVLIFSLPATARDAAREQHCLVVGDIMESFATSRQRGVPRQEVISRLTKDISESDRAYAIDLITLAYLEPRQIDPQDQQNAISDLKNYVINACLYK